MTKPHDPTQAHSLERELREQLAVAQLEYLRYRNSETFDAYKRALRAYSDFVLRGIHANQGVGK